VSVLVIGPGHDGYEGSMNTLSESLSLIKFMVHHNDPTESLRRVQVDWTGVHGTIQMLLQVMLEATN
jgi:hypothetical protein